MRGDTMENLSENLLCALIGVFGTVVGTFIGALLPSIQNGIGRKSIQISNVDAYWGTGQNNIGCVDVSRLTFTLSILNKKGKDLILEKISCKLYSKDKLIHTLKCSDADTYQNIAHRAVFDELIYVDIPAHSSRIVNVHIASSKDLTSCDKVVFCYSWGVRNRETTVWEK